MSGNGTARNSETPPQDNAPRGGDPVFRFEGIGKGSEHRRWCNANRTHAQRRGAAIHEAGAGLRSAIRRESSWPFALDKTAAIAMIRMYHAFLTTLCETEAKAWMRYRRKYVETFRKAPKSVSKFDPNDA